MFFFSKSLCLVAKNNASWVSSCTFFFFSLSMPVLSLAHLPAKHLFIYTELYTQGLVLFRKHAQTHYFLWVFLLLKTRLIWLEHNFLKIISSETTLTAFFLFFFSALSDMKQWRSGGGRRATNGGTDGRSIEAALVASSLLLWLPYSLAAIYVAYCSSFFTEVPLSYSESASPSASAAGPMTSDASASQGFATASASSSSVGSSATASSSAFGSMDLSAVTQGAVLGTETSSAAALHRYSSFYYYIFPAGFDIAVFLPLLLRVLSFSVLAVTVTFYLAVYRNNGGEYLMAVAWALGTCSGYGWLTSSIGPVEPTVAVRGSAQSLLVPATPPSWLWLVVSLLTGLFSGILCKVKDIVDGKHDRDTHLFHMFDRSHSAGAAGRLGKSSNCPDTTTDGAAADDAGESSSCASAARRRRQRVAHVANSHHLVSLGDRLYMVVPFCTGRWFAFILKHGWRGIVVENGAILLSLGLVGYTMLSYKFLKRQVLRASGRVTRSVAARSRSRRNERRLRQQRQTSASGLSGEDLSADSTASTEGTASRNANAEGRNNESGCAGMLPGAAVPLSDEDGEEEMADFFEDVGEVAFIDVIDLISKLFTTSFGVVVLGVVGLNIFMTSLCIPFLKALFKLNALVSGVGIVIELIMYEVA